MTNIIESTRNERKHFISLLHRIPPSCPATSFLGPAVPLPCLPASENPSRLRPIDFGRVLVEIAVTFWAREPLREWETATRPRPENQAAVTAAAGKGSRKKRPFQQDGPVSSAPLGLPFSCVRPVGCFVFSFLFFLGVPNVLSGVFSSFSSFISPVPPSFFIGFPVLLSFSCGEIRSLPFRSHFRCCPFLPLWMSYLRETMSHPTPLGSCLFSAVRW
jgi:hypothetical protein